MKHNKVTHFLTAAYLSFVVGNTSMVYADDTEIYLNSSASTGSANLLFNLDTSGSMGDPVDENNNGVIDAGERSRIDVLKEAMATVLDSLPSLNAGLMRYHYYGGPILYPVAALDTEACLIEGNCTNDGAPTGIQTVTTLISSDNDDVEQEGTSAAVANPVVLNRSGLDFGERDAGTCTSGTTTSTITAGSDDAESRVGSRVYRDTSSDLELPYDTNSSTSQQIIGMRFRSVSIPAGATITDARLTFTIDSTSVSGYNAPIDIIIAGESMAGGRTTFVFGNEPEHRLLNFPTSTTVNWETGEFPAVGSTLTTNNIAGILNELVSDPLWPATGGDDVVLLMVKDPAAAVTATGSRETESFDGGSGKAPVLSVTYETCTGAALEVRTGLRFANVNIPQGSTITSARIDFVATGAPGTGNPDIEVEMENVDSAAPFTTSSLFSTRSFIGPPVRGEDWNTGSTPPLANAWVVDTTYSTPDLSAQVQEVVERSGWCGGNAMMFMVERVGGSNVLRTAYSRELDSTKAPVLTITYDADNPVSGATGCTRTTIVSLLNAGSNDAEEAADGTMDLSSSDLELVEDATTQQVGLRFTDIPVASGTVITSAKIVFTADEPDTGATPLTFNGQLSDDADPFSTTLNNISNTSARPRTSASVTWSPPAFAAIGQTAEITGLEVIVQEIVNQAGWNAGNSLAFLISGTGKRVADSYNGNPATAPRLVMTFEGTPASSKKTVRQALKDVVAGLIQRGGTPIAGSMLEAAYYFRGEPVRFGRQRGDQSASDAVTRLSHPATYQANGASETFPGDCSDSNLGDSDCKTLTIAGGTPTYKSPIVAECQANYLVNLTDGAGYFTGAGLSNSLGQSVDEQVLINSLQAHDSDGNAVSLTNCASDTTLPDGSVYSGDAHDECTVKLAQFLHDNDQIYSASQVLQSGTAPLAESQSLDIYTIGFNLCGLGNVTSGNGSGDQVCCAVANHDAATGICSSPIADPAEITVLKAQAAAGGGEYFNANTVDELVAAFIAITSGILEKNTSFVAPSIAANAFNRLFSRDVVYFGLFEPKRQPRWSGNVKKYKICTVSDINGDGSVLCTLGDVLDDNGNPAVVIDPLAADNGLFTETSRSVWSASSDGREIEEGGAGAEITDFTEREIYTEYNAAVGTAPNGTALNSSGYFIDQSNWDAVETSAVRDEVCPDPTLTAPGQECELRMRWLFGKDVLDEDGDGDTTDTRWWFHDVLHSSPITITYGKDSSDNFIDKIIVGSNEGGLHFINGSTGVEEWVFMPRAVLGKQQDIYDNTAPSHVYGLDSTPKISVSDSNFDGTIDPADDFVGVVFTQRRGGDNMYALDLTPSSTLTSNTQTVVPKFLWEISSASAGFSRLGQTWSEPVIGNILLNDESSRTVILFGGGYDTDLDADDGSGLAKNFGIEAGNPNTGNAIYVVDAESGALIFWIGGTGSGADIEVPEMKYAIPSNLHAFDSNGDSRIDRIYVGDTAGQVWRVDLANVRPGGPAPEGDTVVGILANISTPGTLTEERRFFYEPTVVQVVDTEFSNAANGEYDYVLIGSGNRSNPLDTGVSDRFYAFRDSTIGAMADADSNGIADDYPLNIDGTSNGSPIVDDGTQLIDVTATVLDGTNAAVRGALGWYYDFDLAGTDGEKILAATSVFANTLIFTSYIPDDATLVADPCTAAEGRGRAYNFNILSTRAALDWDEDGTIEDVADRSEDLGTGIPSEGVPIFTKEGVTVLVGTGGGAANLGTVSGLPRIDTYWYEENF
ncbi:MAG: PilC/PilY family type IV pilus protein [Proteobacteria bacterium]|nr:PilC/PilY family type IV pilus protein [Pseudomonadota bacterium]